MFFVPLDDGSNRYMLNQLSFWKKAENNFPRSVSCGTVRSSSSSFTCKTGYYYCKKKKYAIMSRPTILKKKRFNIKTNLYSFHSKKSPDELRNASYLNGIFLKKKKFKQFKNFSQSVSVDILPPIEIPKKKLLTRIPVYTHVTSQPENWPLEEEDIIVERMLVKN